MSSTSPNDAGPTFRDVWSEGRSGRLSRAELRFIHLSRHLSTPLLLSAEQIARYNSLRGYGSGPCTNVPEGHDAEMWRRHNNCT